MGEGERLLTTQEVAGLLRVHPESVRDWIRRGELRAIKLKGRSGNRVRVADLEAFKAARSSGAGTGQATS